MIFGIPLSIFTMDTIVKHYVDKHFPMGKKKWFFGKKVLIHKYYNTGAAFDFLADSPRLIRGIHAGIFAIVFIFYTILSCHKGNEALRISAGMMLGGGASNLSDRLVKGHVVDYVSFGTPFKRFNKIVFNISDFFIFLGAFLFFFQAYKGGRK